MCDGWANDVLVESRLSQIERAHKSVGDILDKRTLPQLEDLSARTWRGRRFHKTYIPAAVDEGPPKLPAGEAAREGANKYRNEEAIWKVKSSEPNYSLKRPVPLKQLYDGLSAKRKGEFHQLCRRSIHALAERLRSEVLKAKSKMDATQLFVPEANEHRAQNLYTHRLYASISSEQIEDRVLEKMMVADQANEVLVYVSYALRRV